jgi:hypothetical protein
MVMRMRIDPLRPMSASTPSRRSEQAGADFSLPQTEAPKSAAPARASGHVLGVGAIMALQTEGDTGARRRRQVRRASAILDELDALQRTLAGNGAEATDRLSAIARLVRDSEPVEEAELESVLREIDVRAAVELAKAERRARR